MIDATVSQIMCDIICNLLKEESKRESILANYILSIALILFKNLEQMNLFQLLYVNFTNSNNVVACWDNY